MDELFRGETWGAAALRIGKLVGEIGAKALIAIAVLVAGFLVARLARAIARRVFARLGADRLLRTTASASGVATDGRSKPSELLAGLLFWLLILLSVLFSVDVFGLQTVNTTFERLVLYLPRIAGAAIIAFLGLLLGRAARDLVTSGRWMADAQNSRRLAGLLNGVIIITTVVLAIEQLGVDTQLLVAIATAAVATLGLAAGVAFALGARPVVTHILAGHFLRQRFRVGQEIEVDGLRGVVTRIGTIDTVVENDDSSMSIPNAELMDKSTSSS